MNILLVILFGLAVLAYIVISALYIKRSLQTRALAPRVFRTTMIVSLFTAILVVIAIIFFVQYLQT